MPVRGRKPQPFSTKLVLGNRGKRPLRTVVAQPRPGDLIRPASVEKNPRASAYWELTLRESAHLSPLDAPLVARYCLALARADAAEELLGDALLTIGQRGNKVRHPALLILNQQTEIARRLASDLCLPPAQRSRLGLHEPPPDPGERYFD